jgi:hypothetical protein
VSAEPWHFTTWLDLFDHWQALIAGALGFAAAIIVVRFTLRIERRKAQLELDAARKSLFELGRSGTLSLINSRDPNNISPHTVAASAIPFLTACEYALSVLPNQLVPTEGNRQINGSLHKEVHTDTATS